MTARLEALTKRMAAVELRLSAVDSRLDDVNRWLLDTLTWSAHASIGDSGSSHTPIPAGSLEHAPALRPGDDAPLGPQDLLSLAAWVSRVAAAFDLSERWPSCWYRHAGLVFELQSLRRWRIALGGQLASDPISAIRWSEALHRVAAQSARVIAQRCLSTHHDAPPLDPIPETALAENCKRSESV